MEIPSVYVPEILQPREVENISISHAVSSLVVAFVCEMDSSAIQLSRKRVSCMPMRSIQVICSDGILLFLFMHPYPSHMFAFSLSLLLLTVCVNYPRKTRQEEQQQQQQ